MNTTRTKNYSGAIGEYKFSLSYHEGRLKWIGRYQKVDKSWSTKDVPVNIEELSESIQWFEAWYKKYLATGERTKDENEKVNEIKTIASLSDYWLRFCKEDRPKTSKEFLNQFTSNMKNHILTHKIAKQNISEIVPDDVAQFVIHLKKNDLAAHTIRNICVTLRCFFTDMIGKRQITVLNPVDKYALRYMPKLVRNGGEVVKLSSDQAQKLLISDNPHIALSRRVKYTVALFTGARDNEIQALSWNCIHLDAPNPYLTIERQLKKAKEFSDPKGDGFRDIPLHPECVKALELWKKTCGRSGEQAVFPGEAGDYIRTNSARYFRNDLKLAGLPTAFKAGVPFVFHALRATFASSLADCGADRRIIDELLGHGKDTTADRHYISAHISTYAPVVGKLPWKVLV